MRFAEWRFLRNLVLLIFPRIYLGSYVLETLSLTADPMDAGDTAVIQTVSQPQKCHREERSDETISIYEQNMLYPNGLRLLRPPHFVRGPRNDKN